MIWNKREKSVYRRNRIQIKFVCGYPFIGKVMQVGVWRRLGVILSKGLIRKQISQRTFIEVEIILGELARYTIDSEEILLFCNVIKGFQVQ